ncbi:hypothetical protein CBR_g69846, partial [Chara braunii]
EVKQSTASSLAARAFANVSRSGGGTIVEKKEILSANGTTAARRSGGKSFVFSPFCWATLGLLEANGKQTRRYPKPITAIGTQVLSSSTRLRKTPFTCPRTRPRLLRCCAFTMGSGLPIFASTRDVDLLSSCLRKSGLSRSPSRDSSSVPPQVSLASVAVSVFSASGEASGHEMCIRCLPSPRRSGRAKSNVVTCRASSTNRNPTRRTSIPASRHHQDVSNTVDWSLKSPRQTSKTADSVCFSLSNNLHKSPSDYGQDPDPDPGSSLGPRNGKEHCMDSQQATDVDSIGVGSINSSAEGEGRQTRHSIHGVGKKFPPWDDSSPFVADLLCLSNGHGEDAIAVSVLRELQMLAAAQGVNLQIDALPLVGLGEAYAHAGFRIVGPVKRMPSGGFVYMDRKQLLGDFQAGLLDLTWSQWESIRQWVKEHPRGRLLAVGDVFPLAMAWLASHMHRRWTSSVDYPDENDETEDRGRKMCFGFIGTAKSEFYIRKANGELIQPSPRDFVEALVSPSCVYLPWERALIASELCQLAVPRDGLTAKVLTSELAANAKYKVADLGNPMMDGLDATGSLDVTLKDHLVEGGTAVLLAIIPGSRFPEVLANWDILVEAASSIATALYRSARDPSDVVFLAPIVPSLPMDELSGILLKKGWSLQKSPSRHREPCRDKEPFSGELSTANKSPQHLLGIAAGEGDTRPMVSVFEKIVNGSAGKEKKSDAMNIKKTRKVILMMVRGAFSDCIQKVHGGLSMAGTATEQLVGLGKPVFTLPGPGPQFTWAFAEAQTRLLGESVLLCSTADEMAAKACQVLNDDKALTSMAKNGRVRMGTPGASARIAESILFSLILRHV